MTQKEYLKILLSCKKHNYSNISIDDLTYNEIIELIEKLRVMDNKDTKVIEELVKNKEEDFFCIKDEFNNFRYFYKLSETKKRSKLVEIVISAEPTLQIRYIKLNSDKILKECIDEITSTKNNNSMYFKLNIEETKKLFELVNIFRVLEEANLNILNSKIFKEEDLMIGLHSKAKIINFTDDEVKQIIELRKGNLHILDGEYDIKSIITLSEKLNNQYNTKDILNIIRNNEVELRINELIETYELMLLDDNILEKDWQNLFLDYQTIFTFIFGEYNINGFFSEVPLSQTAIDKPKIETVDFLIDNSNHIALVELKKHNEKIFEKSTSTRNNLHMNKKVHNGVMQLMYYINPMNINDSLKNKIKKRNYLIIGDQDHHLNGEFESDEKEKALSLYNNFLDKDIQILTYRDILNILKELKGILLNY